MHHAWHAGQGNKLYGRSYELTDCLQISILLQLSWQATRSDAICSAAGIYWKKDCYYTVNIEENGKKARGLRGECEMEWFNADFRSVYVPMDQLPEKVARTVREEIALFEEVMRRTHTVISPHEIFPD